MGSMTVRKALSKLKSPRADDRVHAAQYLYDAAEGCFVGDSSPQEVADAAVEALTVETEDEPREELANLLLELASSNHDIMVNWQALAKLLPELSGNVLAHLVCVLGFSRSNKYLPIIEAYINDSDPSVQEAALSAQGEIRAALERGGTAGGNRT